VVGWFKAANKDGFTKDVLWSQDAYVRLGVVLPERPTCLANKTGRSKKNPRRVGAFLGGFCSRTRHARAFVFVCFSAPRIWVFLGKGSSKTWGKQLSAFPKKITGEICFQGGIFLPVGFFHFFFLSTFFLSPRLSASQ
jgi:hypothetical protein